MHAIDLQQQHREYYQAASTPEIVHVEGGRFLSILGSGSPGSDAFYAKKAALTDMVHGLQKLCSRRGVPFLIAPVEISYWYPDDREPVTIGKFYTTYPLSDLRYRMMIRLPSCVTKEDIEQAEQSLVSPGEVSSSQVEVFEMEGGTVLQVLHTGPFANELGTLEVMQAYADAQRVRKTGPHHEIHLTDWDKEQPQDHLKTILRDPVE